MGNSQQPGDTPLNTDEERRSFVEAYMASTVNPKIVRYKENPMPVNDPVEIKVADTDDSSKMMKLMTYRCPPTGDTRGIIFFIHGF